ncbi:MAG TPA: sigma-70 family RNA polymerase sigma factor [Ktedonobacterales bacterium]|nr:sigma-70 family RNA polymerase sigma factor [Ktedonobacterales bacterium]
MNQDDLLAQQFEEHRAHLRAVAYRVLGFASEADDAVQEAWLRLSRSDSGEIANLGGWLTTVVARVCLDMLRSRESRREEPLDAQGAQGAQQGSESVTSREGEIDPEQESLMADAVGLALLVVLDTLNPAERLAFVLHDLFDVPFDEIAPIVGRSPTAARQLASRARRRVRGQSAVMDADVDLTGQQQVVNVFLAASRAGDFEALLALLDPEVVLRADEAGLAMGAWSGIRGAQELARRFTGAQGQRPALMNGAAGAVWAPGGQPRVAFVFTITDGKIVAIDSIADPERLRQLDPVILDD